jgi:hypothetical protein
MQIKKSEFDRHDADAKETFLQARCHITAHYYPSSILLSMELR